MFLIGFMGSGKSYWAEKLAKKMNLSFVDSDLEIELQEKMSINEIFNQKGEKHFRKREKFWLDNFNESNNVVSVGGGLPVQSDNLKIMMNKGVTIFIDEPFDVCFSRIISSDRPFSSKKKTKLEDLYRKRFAIYKQAHFTIKSPKEVSDFLRILN